MPLAFSTPYIANPNPNPKEDQMTMQFITIWLRGTGNDGGRTLMSEIHATHHDAPKTFILGPGLRSGKEDRHGGVWVKCWSSILGPVLRSGKYSDWLHCGKSCLVSNPATCRVSQNTYLALPLTPTPKPIYRSSLALPFVISDSLSNPTPNPNPNPKLFPS